MPIADGIDDLVQGLRLGRRRSHSRQRRRQCGRLILLEAFDLVCRNVYVPAPVSLQVKASDRAEGLPSLMANGKTVVQYGQIGAKSRQAQQE